MLYYRYRFIVILITRISLVKVCRRYNVSLDEKREDNPYFLQPLWPRQSIIVLLSCNNCYQFIVSSFCSCLNQDHSKSPSLAKVSVTVLFMLGAMKRLCKVYTMAWVTQSYFCVLSMQSRYICTSTSSIKAFTSHNLSLIHSSLILGPVHKVMHAYINDKGF